MIGIRSDKIILENALFDGYVYIKDGSIFSVKAGDIFIIYPHQTITYYSLDIDDTWSFCWIGFSGDKAKEY